MTSKLLYSKVNWEKNEMIQALIQISLKKPAITALFALLITLFGIYSFGKIPIDAFPDVTNVQVQILANASGMSPTEMELNVTKPIEVSLAGLPALSQIRSVSKLGLSVTTVSFEDGTDDYFVRQLVNERLQGIRAQLPSGVEIDLGPITTGLGEIYQYTLESRDSSYNLQQLRSLQDYVVRPQLRAIAGVTDVNSFGGLVKEYQIIADPNRLRQYGMDISTLSEQIQAQNFNSAGGFANQGPEQLIIRGIGRVENITELENLVVKTANQVPLRVKDLAQVQIGAEPRQGAVSKNGQGEVVAGIVMMRKGASGKEVVESVKAKVLEVQKILPSGVAIQPFYDRTELVDQAIFTVEKALIEGMICVILVLVVLMGDWRSSLVVVLTLPLGTLFAFAMMKLLGMSANLMSLGGLAIGIGMMVDGAVVMVENIHRNLQVGKHHKSLIEIVRASALEVAKPVTFGVGMILLVFIPILSLGGMEGKMFKPLAFAIGFALLGSLIAALTLVPVLSRFLLKMQHSKEPSYLQVLHGFYTHSLELCMRRPLGMIILVLALLAASAGMARQIGSEFMPAMDEGCIGMQVFRLPSISLEESMSINRKVEKAVKSFPEVDQIVSKTGRADIASDPMGVDVSDVIITLHPKNKWKSARTKEELVELIRKKLEEIPSASFSFSQPIALKVDELVSGVKSALGIKIFGPDLAVLALKGEEIAQIVRSIRGSSDVNVEKVAGLAYMDLQPERTNMAKFGASFADLDQSLQATLGGLPSGKLFEGEQHYQIVSKIASDPHKPQSIAQIPVRTENAKLISLGELATLQTLEGPAQISRENGSRRIVVESNVEGRDLGGFVAEVKGKIATELQLPPGYSIQWGGQFENQENAMKTLAIVIPATLVGIFLLLILSFGNLRHAALILVNIPLALIGGVFALWWGGYNFSVSASVGFIALFGVAVLNGIVMVSRFNQLYDSGLDLQQALKIGASQRLRPVLMTASAAALGLLPLTWATGPGSEIQKPLASVVLGGLLSSTLLTLFLLPLLYLWIEKLRHSHQKSIHSS